MHRSTRGFPFRGLLLIGLGFFLATMLGGGTATGVAATLLVVPFLLMKAFLVLLLFGFLLRLVGPGGRRHWSDGGHGRGPSGRRRRSGEAEDDIHWRYRGRPMSGRPSPGPVPQPEPSPEQAEWQEHLRQARAEVDDIDAPYRDADVDLGGDGPRD